MQFDEFLNKAWSEHASKTNEVARSLKEGIQLVSESSDIPKLAGLITHVFGEHLGHWEEGIQLLDQLKQNPVADESSNKSVEKNLAVLRLAGGSEVDLDDFSVSDRVTIYSMLAPLNYQQKGGQVARMYFDKALELSQNISDKNDSAFRSLAITGNNLACTLEEKSGRTKGEVELMVLAAKAGREFWERAGTWMNVERAEYRLACTYIEAGNLGQAFKHAQNCIEVCQSNNADPIELFFGYEVLARVEKAKANDLGYEKAKKSACEFFEKLSSEDKEWCKSTLEKI